ncbi:MAG: hypothetical protein J0H40_04000 [Rhizobiales bacterium]|nr:hypothetical protein [Hyphomicrobiales bacterium]
MPDSKSSQPTNTWPTPATADEKIRPRWGWDNEVDVREGTRLCKAMESGLSADAFGERNAYDLAHRLYAQGISERTAVRLMCAFCRPLLSKDDISLQVSSAYSHSVNVPGLLSVARPDAPSDFEDLDDDEDDSWMEGGLTTWPRPILIDPKQNNAKVLDTILFSRPGKVISSNGTLYSLEAESKIWREVSEDAVAAEFRACDPDLTLDTARIRQIARALHVERHTAAQPFDWIDEPIDAPLARDLVLFKNGVLDIGTGVLHPHTGALFATGLPDFNYDPAATCPTWDRCLGEWLHESYHPTLLEFIGYCLTPDTSAHKLLALIGARRGGKSTILNVMSALVGATHTASRTLHDLATDFALEGLSDKKLLLVPDASDTEASRRAVALDRIKAISGGDEVSINRKGLRIVTGHVPARLAIAANRHPRFLDDSGALAARELVVVFERSFEGSEDRELGAKLHGELPGIANAALAALKRLRANEMRFTVGAKGAAALRDLAESQSPALRFAKACLIVTGDMTDRVGLPECFEAYEAWATAESLNSREWRNRNDFKTDLIAALGAQGVRHGRRRWRDPSRDGHGEGAIMRGFFGIKLRKCSL